MQTITDYILTWNRPALVIYLTPLNGLYFSPNKSKRLTFRPETAIWLIVKPTFMEGLLSGMFAPLCSEICGNRTVNYRLQNMYLIDSMTKITDPLMLGFDFWPSTFPTSQESNLLTGSKAYFPWVAVSVQFKTAFGIGMSIFTDSSWKSDNVLEDLMA